MATKHPPDSQPLVNLGGRPPALKPEHIAVLRDIVTERAQASLQEIADELHRRRGVLVCEATIRRGHRQDQASTAGIHSNQGGQALRLHSGASTRERTTVQHQSDRRRMGVGR